MDTSCGCIPKECSCGDMDCINGKTVKKPAASAPAVPAAPAIAVPPQAAPPASEPAAPAPAPAAPATPAAPAPFAGALCKTYAVKKTCQADPGCRCVSVYVLYVCMYVWSRV